MGWMIAVSRMPSRNTELSQSNSKANLILRKIFAYFAHLREPAACKCAKEREAYTSIKEWFLGTSTDQFENYYDFLSIEGDIGRASKRPSVYPVRHTYGAAISEK